METGRSIFGWVHDREFKSAQMKKVAIVQSNYIPWKGYIDLIASVDEFIFFDDVQFTKNDWRNRNKIKTPAGIAWLTVPVGQDIERRIRDVTVASERWQAKHWKTLTQNYGAAEHFRDVAVWLAPLYLTERHTHLSQLNRRFIEGICDFLGVQTKLTSSWDYTLIEGKTERLVDLCVQAGASEYISGPSARAYIDEQIFADRGVKLTWFDYDGYPEYRQFWGDFAHNVSILDLLFHYGKGASRFMRYVRS